MKVLLEWRRLGVSLVILVVAAIMAWSEMARRSDPVIEGKRMSEWALNLVGEKHWRGGYGVRQPYMRVFRKDREAAIRSLMATIDYKDSKLRVAWFRFTRRLPESFARHLRPPLTFRPNLWLGVLALSNLARDRSDPRISEFFLRCMQHDSVPVRKIAAFEAGPWLDPEHPEIALRILSIALEDPTTAVRRDAGRRLTGLAAEANTPYTEPARALLQKQASRINAAAPTR